MLVTAAMAALAPARADQPRRTDASHPNVVQGKVFLDANGNGRLDEGEKGVPGVRVTDSVGFVTTAADGSYTIRVTPDLMLPLPGTQTVAVCWPAGKWPTSKRWFRIKDVRDAAKVNFGLREGGVQKLPFMYLHVTDSHDWRASRYEHQHEVTNTVLKEAKFIIHTGDMSLGGGDPDGMARCARYLLDSQGRCAIPTFTTIGNHDTDSNYGEDHELSFCGGFVRFIGPLRWSFDYAGLHFAFVDVIADKREWNDFTADWLRKDFASLKPGARIVLSYHYPNPGRSAKFRKVIRDHKVQLIHAGHNHAYGHWRSYAAPMITAFARSSGSANMMVVDDGGIHIGFFCDGCSRAGPHSYQHSRRCPVRWRTHVLESSIKGLYGELHKLADLKLAGDSEPVSVSTDAVYVQAEIDRGTAESVGVRLASEPKPLEVSFGGGRLVVDGVSYPFVIPERDKVLKLYVFAHKDMLTVWANECFFLEKPVEFRRAGHVQAFASGGQATAGSLAVQEVKPHPENRNRSYYCGCAHGAILRNPE